MAKARYHHGDLPRMLVEAAVVHLKDHDASTLGLRPLAKAVGVSEAAPYHHFADRRAFEHAVMIEGYALLRARCLAVAPQSLRDLLDAYVGFAVEHPNLFRLIHRSGEARDPANAALAAASEVAFAPLLAEVRRRAQMAGVCEADRIGFLALMVWTQVHGLAEVVISDFLRLGADGASFRERAYAYIEAGLRTALTAD